MIRSLIILALFFSRMVQAQEIVTIWPKDSINLSTPPKRLQNTKYERVMTLRTGELVTEVIGKFKNGKKEGLYLWFYNGKLSRYRTYKQGILHGYYKGDREYGNYTNGIKNGLWEYLHGYACTGDTRSEKITYKKGIQHGYYSNSSEEGFYRNGKKDGEWRYYRENELSHKYELFSVKAYRKDSLVARRSKDDYMYYPLPLDYMIIEDGSNGGKGEKIILNSSYFDKRSKRQHKRDTENVHKYYNNFIKQPKKAKQASKK